MLYGLFGVWRRIWKCWFSHQQSISWLDFIVPRGQQHGILESYIISTCYEETLFKISVNKFLLIWFLRNSKIQLTVHTPHMYTHTHTSIYLFFKELIFSIHSFNKHFKTPFCGTSVLDERVVRWQWHRKYSYGTYICVWGEQCTIK